MGTKGVKIHSKNFKNKQVMIIMGPKLAVAGLIKAFAGTKLAIVVLNKAVVRTELAFVGPNKAVAGVENIEAPEERLVVT